MVESVSTKPSTMWEFFCIHTQSFERQDRQQLKVLVGIVNKAMKDAWSVPTLKTIQALKRFESLIPPIIRDNYANIVGGGSRYKGFCREVTSISEAQWNWQIHIQCTICGDTRGEVPI